METNWRRIELLAGLAGAVSQPRTMSAGTTQTTTTLNQLKQQRTQDEVGSMEVEETPKGRRLARAKRRRNRHTPQSAEQKAKKKNPREEQRPSYEPKRGGDGVSEEWQEVRRNKKRP